MRVRFGNCHRRMTNARSPHVSYLQQHSAVGVHIGPGVLGLALLQQHVGHNLVKLCNHLEQWVVGQVFQGKLTLTGVTWVSLPQDSMAVAWHNLWRETTCSLNFWTVQLLLPVIFELHFRTVNRIQRLVVNLLNPQCFVISVEILITFWQQTSGSCDCRRTVLSPSEGKNR